MHGNSVNEAIYRSNRFLEKSRSNINTDLLNTLLYKYESSLHEFSYLTEEIQLNNYLLKKVFLPEAMTTPALECVILHSVWSGLLEERRASYKKLKSLQKEISKLLGIE